MTPHSTSRLGTHGGMSGSFVSAHAFGTGRPVIPEVSPVCGRRQLLRGASKDAQFLVDAFQTQLSCTTSHLHFKGRKEGLPIHRARPPSAVPANTTADYVSALSSSSDPSGQSGVGRPWLSRAAALPPQQQQRQRHPRPQTAGPAPASREAAGVRSLSGTQTMNAAPSPEKGSLTVRRSRDEAAISLGADMDVHVGGGGVGLAARRRITEPAGGRGSSLQPPHRSPQPPHRSPQPPQQQQQQQQLARFGLQQPLRPRLLTRPGGSSTADPLELEATALKTGLALTWLGTNSGTPSLERNVSCTLVRMPGTVQMVDCGEGTHRQLMAVEGLDPAEVDGIFITHLHGDHCFGLGATLELLDELKAVRQTDPTRRRNHVYGPPGLAELLRASLLVTGLSRRLQLPLTITELVCSPSSAHPPRLLEDQHHQRQQLQQHAGVGWGSAHGCGAEVLVQRIAARHVQEVKELQSAARAVGQRLAGLQEIWTPPPRHLQYGQSFAFGRVRQGSGSRSGADDSDSETANQYSSIDEDLDDINAGGGNARRRQFVAKDGLFWEIPGCAGVRVRAAQLQHRIACWGYAFQEVAPYEPWARRRKVVVLGDTVCSRPIAPLAAGCDVLAHEATFARGMEEKARIAQHSTGWMAGAFAAAVGARSLVLTHFSSRYRESSPRSHQPDGSYRISRASARLEADQQAWAVAGLLQEATQTYGKRQNIFAASDFYTHHVQLRSSAAAEAAAAAGADTGEEGQDAGGGGGGGGGEDGIDDDDEAGLVRGSSGGVVLRERALAR